MLEIGTGNTVEASAVIEKLHENRKAFITDRLKKCVHMSLPSVHKEIYIYPLVH